ncbi:MAG TPA: peptidoglycan DD-metalloendopeptidase family protein [Actinomycetota bacterium]|nr:peptidoglycan DD-metalloendopeptidase family protein [Actinomycetota bacterium]
MVALLMGAAALTSVPVWAQESKLDAAKNRLESARSELDRVTGLWQQTESRLAQAQDAAADARTEIFELEGQLAGIQRSLNDRVAAAFMSGGSFSIGALLTSDSIQDAADRLQYTQSVVQGDADLATRVAVMAEELRRQETRLQSAARLEAQAAADLESQREQISAKVQQLNDVVQELEAQLEAADRQELNLGGGVSLTGTGAIQTCPVAGNNSFVDSFGWPRSGGRTHQGIDLIAAAGTPVVAVASGNAREASSVLGGLGIVLEHDSGGDWTFYAHLSSFGAMGQVSAGTVIGYVGATGTTVNHLHFEYHPSGGAAVNPYAALRAVC